jgi:hypothetical protein
MGVRAWWKGKQSENPYMKPERHWTSTEAHNAAGWIGGNYQWLIGTLLAPAALVVALLAFIK